jgi:hypothetical protein
MPAMSLAHHGIVDISQGGDLEETAAMSDPSRLTRFEGRQGDGDATIHTHQHYRSIID